MPIDKSELQRHLDDYYQVFGRKTEQFICPITLRPTPEDCLINGHIVNEAFRYACRRTVLESKDVDAFYGTRLEASLVKYMNLSILSKAEILKSFSRFRVRFPNGTEADAFFDHETKPCPFPRVELSLSDGSVFPLRIKVAEGDSRISEKHLELEIVYAYVPDQYVGALLKSGLLALFDLLGYTVVYNAYTFDFRTALSSYYLDRASRADAPKYFGRFDNAVCLFTTSIDLKNSARFDTLVNRELLFHNTKRGTMFAASCIFQINGVAVTITLPQTLEGADPAVVAEYYGKLLRRDADLVQDVRVARLHNDHWSVSTKPLVTHYVDLPSAEDDALG